MSTGQITLDIIEAARIAGQHPATIRRYVNTGVLPHFRIGGKIHIRPAALAEFLVRQQSNLPHISRVKLPRSVMVP